jgi:hypothetical protein
MEEFNGVDKFHWEENLKDHARPRTNCFINKVKKLSESKKDFVFLVVGHGLLT